MTSKHETAAASPGQMPRRSAGAAVLSGDLVSDSGGAGAAGGSGLLPSRCPPVPASPPISSANPRRKP